MRAPRFLGGACAVWLGLTTGCFYLDHESGSVTRTSRENLDEPRLEVTPRLVELSGDRLRIEAPAERIERYEERSSTESDSSFDLVLYSLTYEVFEDADEDETLGAVLLMPFTIVWDVLLPITGTFYNLGDAVLSGGGSEGAESEVHTARTAVALPAVALVDPATGARATLSGESGSWELGLDELAAAGLRGPSLELRGAEDQRLSIALTARCAERLRELAAEIEALPAGERIEVAAGADLSRVLADARESSVVVLAPGSYLLDGELSIRKSITISGAGALRTELRCGETGARIELGAPAGSAGVVLRDLSVLRGSSEASALVVITGPARIARCRVIGAEGGSGSGIEAAGTAEVAIERSRFELHPSGALLWSGDAQGQVQGNFFARCQPAISVREHACPRLGANRFEDVPTPVFAEWAEAR